MTESPMWTDEALAALDLVARTGARSVEICYLHDDVPTSEADWYAHAQFRGARITCEHHPGPAEALEALARRLLTGAQCTGCGKLIALCREGAMYFPDGYLLDGTPWNEDHVRAVGQCRWSRVGARWEMGCKRE